MVGMIGPPVSGFLYSYTVPSNGEWSRLFFSDSYDSSQPYRKSGESKR